MNKNLTIYNTDQRIESTRDEDRKSSYKLRLLTRVGIVFLILIAVITLPSLPALADGKSRAPKKVRAIKDINDGATKDLKDSVKKVEPKAAKAKKSKIRGARTQIIDRSSGSARFQAAETGCSNWACTSNHNETLVRDTTPMK